MNHRIQEVAVRAWQDHADINVPAEEWMAGFIETLGQYLIEECVMVLNTDITAQDDFGPDGGKAMKRASELIKNYFGIEDETHN
jgi:hypothetical protein